MAIRFRMRHFLFATALLALVAGILSLGFRGRVDWGAVGSAIGFPLGCLVAAAPGALFGYWVASTPRLTNQRWWPAMFASITNWGAFAVVQTATLLFRAWDKWYLDLPMPLEGTADVANTGMLACLAVLLQAVLLYIALTSTPQKVAMVGVLVALFWIAAICGLLLCCSAIGIDMEMEISTMPAGPIQFAIGGVSV